MADSESSGQWLFGPVPDLLIGCGVMFSAVFVGSIFLGATGPAVLGLGVLPAVLLLLSHPHYGATILRVYEQREDRQRYYLFTVWATIAVFVWFVLGSRSAFIASTMVTVYLTWSPWHYTGQNYGIAVMLLRRRGVDLGLREKRLVYASFILSFLMTATLAHSEGGVVDYALGTGDGELIRFIPLGIPGAITAVLFPVFGVAYLLVTVAAAVLLLKKGSATALLPAALLMLTQALWFSIPVAIELGGIETSLVPLDWDQRLYFFNWIAAGHAAQYLWITSYYARGTGRWNGLGRYYGKALLAGVCLFLPLSLMFGTAGVGKFSFSAGFALLVSAAVNIHHFLLDGAIWKLRSGRIASILIRSVKADPEPLGPTPRLWPKIVWPVAALFLAVEVATVWTERIELPGAAQRGDAEGVASALDRLSWIGRDNESVRTLLFSYHLERGEIQEAIAELERATDLFPTVANLTGLGQLYQQHGKLEAAIEAYNRALTIDPERVGVLHRAGTAWIELGRPDEAIIYLNRALAIDPAHGPSRQSLVAAKKVRRGPSGAPRSRGDADADSAESAAKAVAPE